MNVLVVDDFLTMRRILKNILKQVGFKKMDEAEDGAQALDMIKNADPPFDLIIADWNMPKMTGIELLKAIRADPDLKHLPVIMVTAEAQKSRVLEAVQAGVSNYIVKPFTAETVKGKLEQVFK
ncbi:MAG: Chemotaxis protein cheY [Candidatus Magnetoglobus multicellularis str. Araruama]|uniref:Chemotaxis protein cheY n=1 Tax=Candidatus Magnetoglobus multicellularis str. Araruama TaxID=890399 RepID=A0A1V1PHD5_9BACT|nr:MAG: Chemotaxis protein cheY [Candidatus Magnetoglobus multicellularis str. Araruama]